MRTGIVIQARMGSSRFPGKILAPLAGRPLLEQLVNRLLGIQGIDLRVIATSTLRSDVPVALFSEYLGLPCFRGSEHNVLKRYADAAVRFQLEAVVRVCGDSPLTDPDGIRALLSAQASSGSSFVHNRHATGWPVGTAADLITTKALLETHARAKEHREREHVIPYMIRHGRHFGERKIEAPPHLQASWCDFSVDHPHQLKTLNQIMSNFPDLSFREISLSAVLSLQIVRATDPNR
ncbi:MAG: cytidylyltransferase domain-containing protein, partial [Acidobacteriota bacterium]